MSNLLLRKYEEISGEDAQDLLRFTRRKYLRVNTLKTSAEKLIPRLEDKEVKLWKTDWLTDCYSYHASFSLGATTEYLLGLFHVQDAASQLPVEILKLLCPNARTIVDMAASPGGKTTHLAALFPSATIIALEENRKRTSALKNTLERLGTSNVQAYLKDARYASDITTGVDAILLDAPCSGNYTLHKEWLQRREKQGFTFQASLQKDLLKEALRIISPGGVILYSTCSLDPEENEAVLTAVLDSKDKILKIPCKEGQAGLSEFRHKKFRDDCVNTRRLWPHDLQTQGFFLAAIQKHE